MPKSGPEIQNHCTETPEISRICALIHDSGPEIKNHYTKAGVIGEKLAPIPDSGLEIKNQCTKEGGIGEKLASIRKFRLEIKNRCTECLRNQGFIHEIGQYRGWDWAEAGTGRHEGGITLN